MSTGIGLGLAVPHVRLEGGDEQMVAVGLSPEGIDDYESVDKSIVRLVVMIIGGKGQHKEHISLLASIVSLFKNDAVRASILASKTEQELYSALTGNK